jgi:hypothetical protein
MCAVRLNRLVHDETGAPGGVPHGLPLGSVVDLRIERASNLWDVQSRHVHHDETGK